MRPTPCNRVFRASRPLFAVIVASALIACSAEPPDHAATPAPDPQLAAAPAPTRTPTPAPSDAPFAALDAEALAVRTDQAIADNRLYAPAGDNAIEYFLAKRDRAARDGAGVEAALIELQPYAMIAAEQAITTGDLVEAERLVDLMARIDATAPSLARLRGDIDAARLAQAEADKREIAEAAAQTEAQTEAQAVPVATRVAGVAEAPRRAAAVAAASSRERASAAPPPAPARAPRAIPEPARRAATARPADSRAVATELVPVATPFPPFPSEAIARGRSMGSVTVRFTVRPNGRVTGVRVVDARPEGLFERTVTETLADWRFEPIAAEQTQTRTFNFRN